MKLMFAIVQNDDAKWVIRSLIQNRISVTRISSSGGFLHGGNATLMIGIEADRVQEALDIIKSKSNLRKEFMVIPSSGSATEGQTPAPIPVTLGGATVFVVDVEEFHKF